MRKVLETLQRNFKYYFLHFLLIPILVTVLFYLIFLVIKFKKTKCEISFKDFLKDNIFNIKNLLTMVPVLYSLILYHSTVTNRIITNQRFEPLSNVLGGWKIIEWQYFYDLSPVWNIVMFLPMAAVIYAFLRYSKNIKISNLKMLTFSSLLSLLMSLIIEVSQIIFHAGTFQISDLFYNTLGGFIGAMIYFVIINISKKISTKR